MLFDTSKTDARAVQCQQNATFAVAPQKCCGTAGCPKCASTLEKAIREQVQELPTRRNSEQEMLFIPVHRLACLPLTESSFLFLKHQFRIVKDYLTENQMSENGNLWGAIYHLRLIGARIRAARESLADSASSCEIGPLQNPCNNISKESTRSQS